MDGLPMLVCKGRTWNFIMSWFGVSNWMSIRCMIFFLIKKDSYPMGWRIKRIFAPLKIGITLYDKHQEHRYYCAR